jgi:hypothetical protein
MVAVPRAALCVSMLLWAEGALAQDVRPAQPTVGTIDEGERASNGADAQSLSATAESEARLAFEDGLRLLRAERWLEAEVRFRRSLALSPRPSTTYDLAFVLYKERRGRQSAEILQGLLELPSSGADTRYRDYARALLQRVLTAQPYAPIERTVLLPPPRLETRRPFLRSVAPWLTVGLGGAMLAGAAVTGALAKRADGAFGAMCPTLQNCDQNLTPLRDSAVRLGRITDVLLVSGAVLVAGGTTWRILVPPTALSQAGAQGILVVASGAY